MPSRDLHAEFWEELVRDQLRERDCILASGARANNHLDMGYSEVALAKRSQVGMYVGTVAINNLGAVPDFIGAVPNGVLGWGTETADFIDKTLELPRPVILELSKTGRREFAINTDAERAIAKVKDTQKGRAVQGIVLDDATSNGGTSEIYADLLTKQGLQIGLVVSLVLRGETLPVSKYPRGYIWHKHIPTKLNWPIYREQGIIVPL